MLKITKVENGFTIERVYSLKTKTLVIPNQSQTFIAADTAQLTTIILDVAALPEVEVQA